MDERLGEARRLMSADAAQGEEYCGSCGVQKADKPLKKAGSGNFSAFEELLLYGNPYVCDDCIAILADSAMRTKPILCTEQGKREILERGQVLRILKNPPERFVLSVPYSFKKHHWLYAGISTPRKMLIGTDNRTVEIDAGSADVSSAIDAVAEAVKIGVPRAELIRGKYSIFTKTRFGAKLDELESKIGDLRPSGAVELIVKYTPAVKEKIKFEGEEKEIMLTKSEQRAIDLLKEIAKYSEVRANNGLIFWQSYFLRRINRFANADLNTFASKLAEACRTSVTGANLGMITAWTEEECAEIMREIREKADLLVNLTYTIIKGEQIGRKKRAASD